MATEHALLLAAFCSLLVSGVVLFLAYHRWYVPLCARLKVERLRREEAAGIPPNPAELLRLDRVSRHVLARGPAGDALNLAIASYYSCDFLITWNCIHLANPTKTRHIQRINDRLGLATPVLTMPLNMLGQDV